MARPIAARRHDEILRRIAAAGTVSVEELAGHFDVSRETIRRDFKALADRGQLDIVHGGAVRKADESALSVRLSENPAGKAAIGRTAARLVETGMVVLLDSGATTLAVAEALSARIAAEGLSLTICTSSLPIALLLCRAPGTRVHMLGGEIDPNDESAFGLDAIEALSRFRVDIAFVGAGGLSQTGDITDFTRLAAEQRARMIASAAKAYVVADNSKFGRLTPIRITGTEQVAGIIVDARPGRALIQALARRGVRLLVADEN
jgi:DeoR/GlpR family transcriptional regulator of sugar metabolism